MSEKKVLDVKSDEPNQPTPKSEIIKLKPEPKSEQVYVVHNSSDSPKTLGIIDLKPKPVQKPKPEPKSKPHEINDSIEQNIIKES